MNQLFGKGEGTTMNREQALPYVSYCLDDALAPLERRPPSEIPKRAVLVGWQCGFEPMFVAVWSYLPNCKLDAESAVEIATDYLEEIGWLSADRDKTEDGPDYVIT